MRNPAEHLEPESQIETGGIEPNISSDFQSGTIWQHVRGLTTTRAVRPTAPGRVVHAYAAHNPVVIITTIVIVVFTFLCSSFVIVTDVGRCKHKNKLLVDMTQGNPCDRVQSQKRHRGHDDDKVAFGRFFHGSSHDFSGPSSACVCVCVYKGRPSTVRTHTKFGFPAANSSTAQQRPSSSS